MSAAILSVSSTRLRPFKRLAAPDEFAAIVAGWPARDVARFLIGLGYAIEERVAECSPRWPKLVAHQIVAEELGLERRYGTDFILSLASIVGPAQATEVAP